jgi:hypothetical protein
MPEDLAVWIEAKAKSEGRPQNRIIINALAVARSLEALPDLMTAVGDMKVTLAQYSSRITMHDLSDDLLRALDTALAASGSAQQAALDKVRVIRAAMRKTAKANP